MSGLAPERLHFVVPAFDEAANLTRLLENLRRFVAFSGERATVWIVDDGSRDATAEVVRRAAAAPAWSCPRAAGPGCPLDLTVHLLQHATNQGPGEAFRTGLTAALAQAADDDWIVTLEADNTSDLGVLARMLDRGRRGADLVLASVYGEGRVVGAPWERRLLSWGANNLVRALFGLWGLHTFSSFFRLHRARLLRRAFAHHGAALITEPGFVCMVELLIKLLRLGARVDEVPMLLDSNVRVGDSKLKILRTTRSYLRLLLRLRLPAASSPAAPRAG